MAATIAACSLSTMAAGVPFGRKMPFQAAASKSGSPCSLSEASPGMTAVRSGRAPRSPWPAALDLRLGDVGERALVVDAAGDQILHRRPAAAIGNMRDVDADRGVEQRAGQMTAAAHPGRAVLHGRLMGLRISHELLEVAGRKRVLAISTCGTSKTSATAAKSVAAS